MENREVIDIIAESQNKKWFDEKKIEINYPIINQRRTFDSFIAFYNYIDKQVQLKAKVDKHQNVPFELRTIIGIFEGILNNLLFLVANFSNENDSQLENHWNELIKNQLSGKSYLIPLDSDLFDTLLELNDKSITAFEGAYKYAFENSIIQNNRGLITKETLDGILEVHRVTKGERFYSNLLEIKEKELEELKHQFEGKIANSDERLTDYLANINKKYTDYTNEIDQYKSNKEFLVNSWFDETKSRINNFDETSKTKIEDLEKTYSEKLKLSAPAQYWKARSEKLYKEGQVAMGWLIVLVTVACVLIYILLWQTPEGMLTNIFYGDKSKAIRWSIVFITFISFLAVAFRMLSKLMFSAFHLSRDAEEREQLSYFYLALIKEGAVEKEDRLLIMQSLFSRADSGLLKDDSSPTMPGGMLDKIVQK
jgi:hypothetical protein